jgi:uncharacterized protein YyaL (SSP411 family)
MRAPDGAFYSGLDADSDGHKGKYYVWTADEVRASLTPHFGLDRASNFERHAWNLRVAVPLERVADGLGLAPEEARRRLRETRAALSAVRDARVHPGREEKILTSWNALAMLGLPRAMNARSSLPAPPAPRRVHAPRKRQ